MTLDLRSAKSEMSRRLLEAHERSNSFGKPGPWPRDVIVTIDQKTFPSAFAPDGREELESLCLAIEELRRAGACRVVYEKSKTAMADQLPRQVRVGPDEVTNAYSIGVANGFVPLSEAIDSVRRQIATMTDVPMAAWVRDYLSRVDGGLANADPVHLGMGRERFKRDSIDVRDALAAIAAISVGVDSWERMLSERIFGRTKRLSAIRSLVARLLVRCDPSWVGFELDDTFDVLEAYGVRRKPGTLRCAGGGVLVINGRDYRLADFIPTASLPEAWGGAWCESAVASAISCITTIENEFSFLAYVDESGGVNALAERREMVVYVAGFPGPWLTKLLAETQRRTRAELRHWGDADVGGLLIWQLLRTRVGARIDFFRTTDAWVREQAVSGGQPLSARERAALHRLRESFETMSLPDYAQASAVARALLDTNVKLEQERY
jgi:hypothetical protein